MSLSHTLLYYDDVNNEMKPPFESLISCPALYDHSILTTFNSNICIYIYSFPVRSNEPFEVAIINKTALDESYREHLSIAWLLNHDQYVQNDGSRYNTHHDLRVHA